MTVASGCAHEGAKSDLDDLRIDSTGEITAGPSARALLERNAGDWMLLQGGPGLLLGLREANHGLYPELRKLEPGPAALAGDLAEVLPSEVLNFLHQGRRSGVLLTKSGAVERAIVLQEGAVAWAASTSPGERFGELICRMGLVPRAALDATLQEQAQAHNHRPLGQLLGERGLLEPEECWRALRHQVVEIFLGLLVLRSGTFVFHCGLDVEKLPAQLSLDIEALLLDGLRRLDEMEFYRQRVSSPLLVPRATGVNAPAADGDDFTPEMRRLLPLVDGRLSMAQLSELSALGEFEATKAAYKLMKSGHLRPEGRSDPTIKIPDPKTEDPSPFDPGADGGW